MTWDEETPDGDGADPWASRTAHTLKLTERISTLLFVGAGLALVLGVVIAIASYNATGAQLSDVGGVFSGDGAAQNFAAVQSMTYLSSSLLPGGVLAAAAVALRLQVARFEADVLGA